MFCFCQTQMEITPKFLVFSCTISIFFSVIAQSADLCFPVRCGGPLEPLVRFPFRLKTRQPPRCGYPGFDLYCNSKNQTILKLPQSGEFKVNYIDYNSQSLFINDPDSCLPNRILNFNLSGSSFVGAFVKTYTFLNCSSDWINYRPSYRVVPLNCLSGSNYTVLAANSRLSAAQVPSSCRRIASISVPLQWSFSQFYWSSMDLTEDLELMWTEPACWNCENQSGGICGFKSDSGLQIGCFKLSGSKPRISRGARYGLIIGVGVPGLVCIIGVACYTIGMIKAFTTRRRPNSGLPTTTTSEPPYLMRAGGGLDLPTIASYPKMVLGDSGRLPEPTNGTCPICLCDYEPKETLRSIPACNHYFHADCVDEWLKLNATCPLCRNSPESSVPTPCSSLSLSSSSASTTTTTTTSDGS